VDERLPGRFELAGPAWLGPVSYGTSDATETAADGSRFRLFSTSTGLQSAPGLEARLGVRMTRALQAEAEAAYGRPTLTTKITGDAESAAPVSATEPITQLTIQGALLAHLTVWHIGRGGVPFVSAGAGYLRQLHQARALAETGETYHFGGGVKYLFLSRQASRLKGLGVRAEARAVVAARDCDRPSGAHLACAAASIFVRF
jgi:hypothetical protein